MRTLSSDVIASATPNVRLRGSYVATSIGAHDINSNYCVGIV